MTDYKIELRPIHFNLSATMFHQCATQYYRCKQGFNNDGKFSPVPYFLLCRAIELELKAKHLQSTSREDVKKRYGHNIKKSYDEQEQVAKILDVDEYRELERASEIYDNPHKGFEYVNVKDALKGFSHFPDLSILDRVAHKLIGDDF